MQAVLLLDHIVAVQQHGNSGGISAGAADAPFLHGLDQSGLGKARRRLGKVLISGQTLAVQPISYRQFRQSVAVFGGIALIPAFQIEGAKAGKFQHGAGGPEVINRSGSRRIRSGRAASGVNIHGRGIGKGVGHLAG